MKQAIPALIVLVLVGCHFPEAWQDFTKKPKDGGPSMAERVVEAIPKVAVNPGYVPGWIEIVGGVGGLIATAIAGKKVNDARKKKKAFLAAAGNSSKVPA